MLTALHQIIEAECRGIGLDDRTAAQLAVAITERVRCEYGGCSVYIGLRKRIDPNAVRSAFNGKKLAAVCSAFGISKSTLYSLLRNRGNESHVNT